MSNKNPEQFSPEVMRQFTGSEHWYRGTLNRKVVFTDGAKHVADHGGAYWLLDEIALAQLHVKAVAAEEFQVWKLKVDVAAAHRHAHLRGRQRQQGVREGARIYRLPASRNHALVCQQHHLSAERILKRREPRGTVLLCLFPPAFSANRS